eukprot:GHVQ01019043.1.p1 GENE.GHVQ01019043.1~~GHVQ01019043.1.p1  ORF type:complete len:421 (+),score=67.84 GHVQ01019043.1:255-1517(+)
MQLPWTMPPHLVVRGKSICLLLFCFLCFGWLLGSMLKGVTSSSFCSSSSSSSSSLRESGEIPFLKRQDGTRLTRSSLSMQQSHDAGDVVTDRRLQIVYVPPSSIKKSPTKSVKSTCVRGVLIALMFLAIQKLQKKQKRTPRGTAKVRYCIYGLLSSTVTYIYYTGIRREYNRINSMFLDAGCNMVLFVVLELLSQCAESYPGQAVAATAAATVEEATVEEATVEEATVEEATVEEATVEAATVKEATVAATITKPLAVVEIKTLHTLYVPLASKDYYLGAETPVKIYAMSDHHPSPEFVRDLITAAVTSMQLTKSPVTKQVECHLLPKVAKCWNARHNWHMQMVIAMNDREHKTVAEVFVYAGPMKEEWRAAPPMEVKFQRSRVEGDIEFDDRFLNPPVLQVCDTGGVRTYTGVRRFTEE